jgi:6-phosphogluconolactonase (cycloisomerase 2 family)
MAGDNVAVFRIDAETGRLKAAGEPIRETSPSCIMLLP